jgi:hypothetical protein
MMIGNGMTVLAPSVSTLMGAFFCALAAGLKATLSSYARYSAAKPIF